MLKKLLCLLLTAALLLLTMPLACAQEIVPPQARGLIQLNNMPANEDSAVLLAQVTDALGDWDTHSTSLPVFEPQSAQPNVRPGVVAPGMDGSYCFTLHNRYSEAISYVFTHEAAPAEALRFSLAQGAPSGTVPPGGSVEFQLDWEWRYYVSESRDVTDTDIGRQSAVTTQECTAVLKFAVEAEEAATPENDWWKWLVAGAMLAGGGTVAAGAAAARAIGSISVWGAALSLPVVIKCWLHHTYWGKDCDCGEDTEPSPQQDPDPAAKPVGSIKPPSTGDHRPAILAGLGVALCAAYLLLLLLRKRNQSSGRR